MPLISFSWWTQLSGAPVSHKWFLIHCSSSSCFINKIQALVTEKMWSLINHLCTNADFLIHFLASEQSLSLWSTPWMEEPVAGKIIVGLHTAIWNRLHQCLNSPLLFWILTGCQKKNILALSWLLKRFIREESTTVVDH